MKKYLITLALALTLGMTGNAAAQSHRHHTPTGNIVTPPDSTTNNGVDAFSDTTSVGGSDTLSTTTSTTTTGTRIYRQVSWSGDEDIDDEFVLRIFDGVMNNMGTFAIIAVVAGLAFILLPVIIIGIIVHVSNKHHRERMRMAEAAMNSGQPIPDQLVTPAKPETDDEVRKRGIRQTCLGIGLIIFLGSTAGNVGLGIGALVTCIGVGNLLIARRNKPNDINIEH